MLTNENVLAIENNLSAASEVRNYEKIGDGEEYLISMVSEVAGSQELFTALKHADGFQIDFVKRQLRIFLADENEDDMFG